MNTAELIKLVANEHGVAKEQVKTILDSVFAAITATAIAGEEVALNGFGRFKLADRAERQGRNSATGETITIAASKKLAFIPAKTVREALSAATAAPPIKKAPAETGASLRDPLPRRVSQLIERRQPRRHRHARLELRAVLLPLYAHVSRLFGPVGA